MVIFNLAQWTGNYNAAEIQSIRMWLFNEGASAMRIRVAINGGNNTWFVSTTGFALPADDTWRQATFDLNANAMTRVGGTDSFSTVFNSVIEMRILSNNNPDFRGASMFATLGVDDIEAMGAEPEPISDRFLDIEALSVRL